MTQKRNADVLSNQEDGFHKLVKQRGQAIANHEKRSKTSNILILKDSRGICLVCSDLSNGNQNHTFELIQNIEKMNSTSRFCGITGKGFS